MIGIHPQAVLAYPGVPPDLRREIETRIAGYAILAPSTWTS
jgi:hypothetical protein